MASDDLLRRMEALNGGSLAERPPMCGESAPTLTHEPPDTDGLACRAPINESMERLAVVPSPDPKFSLERARRLAAAIPGATRETLRGEYYHVSVPLEPVAPGAAWLQSIRQKGRVLFLDVETLGLRGEPIFLAGLLTVTSGEARFDQLFARDEGEEAGVLAACMEQIQAAEQLVTFNGESYDLPLIRQRAAAHRIRVTGLPAHTDVLLTARALHGRSLPNCRLQTLEERLCGRRRDGDVPGHEIPGAYRRYLAAGETGLLPAILEHNRLDLATTAELYARFYI